MRLLVYILKRLLLVIPTLIGVTFVCFALVRVLPGNPVYFILGPYATEEEIAKVKTELGFDKPIYEQYFIYLDGILHGDLGYAWHTSQPVADDIKQRFPLTIELATISLILTLIVAVPLGVISAVKRGAWVDNIARVVAVVGVSMPMFWSGLLLIYVFFFKLGWAPPPMGALDLLIEPPPRVTGMILMDSLIARDWEALKSAGSHLILPAITLALPMIGSITRMTRSSMAEVLHSDYVRTATAFGLPRRTVIYRDALQNALLPVVTMIGVLYGFALGGAVLVEMIFGLTGMGSYSFGSIMNLDYAGVQGVVLLVAMIFVIINLVIDILYAIIDPRISYT
jgi:ABC-type dipeptide/oligopeptide/nickel transport system permease component